MSKDTIVVETEITVEQAEVDETLRKIKKIHKHLKKANKLVKQLHKTEISIAMDAE